MRKSSFFLLALCFSLITAHADVGQRSQSFHVDEYFIISGGASLVPNQFAVWGGIGPPGTGMSASDNFVIWAGIIVWQGSTSHVQLADGVTRFAVLPNVPNPFEESTLIRYELPMTSEVSINIYDPSGRLVRELKAPHQGPGHNALRWDGRDSHGKTVSTGVYFYRLQAGTQSHLGRVIVIR